MISLIKVFKDKIELWENGILIETYATSDLKIDLTKMD